MLEHVSHRVNSSSLALTIRNEIAAALSRLIRQPPLDATQDAHLGHHQQFRVTTPVTGIDSSSVFHNSLSTHSHVVNMDSVPGITAVQPSVSYHLKFLRELDKVKASRKRVLDTYIPRFLHGAYFSRLPLFFVHIWYPKC